MLLHARDNNIQSFAYIWLYKGNQNEFLTHPKIKWLDKELEPQPLDCRSIALPLELILPIFGCLLIAYMNVAYFIMLQFNYDVITI